METDITKTVFLESLKLFGFEAIEGGIPNSVFNKKIVLIRDSISEISP